MNLQRFLKKSLFFRSSSSQRKFLPQWECKTAKVQKIASVKKVVWIKGTIKAGICKTETPRSMVHILTWSPELLLTALVAKSCCLPTKDPFAVNKGFLMTIFCMQRNCCLIKVVANMSVEKNREIKNLSIWRDFLSIWLTWFFSFFYLYKCLSFFVTFLFWQFYKQIFFKNAINSHLEKYLGFSKVLMYHILRRSSTYHWLLQSYFIKNSNA